MRGRVRGKMDTEIGFSYQIQSVLGTMRFFAGADEPVKDCSVWQSTHVLGTIPTHTHTLGPSFYSGDVWILLLTSSVRWWIPLLPKCLTYDLVLLWDVKTIAKHFYDLRKLNMCRECPGKSPLPWQIKWKFRHAQPFFAAILWNNQPPLLMLLQSVHWGKSAAV